MGRAPFPTILRKPLKKDEGQNGWNALFALLISFEKL
jgi:hypothetical protein